MLAAVLSLCGIWPGAAAPAARPEAHTVVVEAVSYQPKVLTIRVGDSVVWLNKDPFPHTATSTAAGFDSKVIEPGKSWRYTAKTRGEFPYTCALHPTMTGVVKVR